MLLFILRGVVFLLAAMVATLYLLPNQQTARLTFEQFLMIMMIVMGVTGAIILVDVFQKRKKLSAISGVFLGLLAGLLAAYALSFVVNLIGLLVPPPGGVSQTAFNNLLSGLKVFIGLLTCYLGISFVLQTRDDFRFIIPYVEFAKEIRGSRPTILDTSVIIDGRIVDILPTRILQGTLLVPKFVLEELQAVADSSDKLRRARGRRGLDMLQKLQDNGGLDIVIDDTLVERASVDQMLVSLAQAKQCRIMTNDFNLNKLATLRGVEVINLNDVAKALRPVVLPGEPLHVHLVKAGEAAGQAVGFLDDGTMVVAENARYAIGRDVDLVVTSAIQTSAGRMIFGQLAETTNGSRNPAPSGLTPRPPAPGSRRDSR